MAKSFVSLISIAGNFLASDSRRHVSRAGSLARQAACGVKGPGQPSARIINGEDADECEWVWQVSLQDSSGSHSCGGVLLTPEWVITAAHCVSRGGTTQVAVGEFDQTTQSGHEQVAQIAHTIVHPGWDWTGPHDIAMLQLQSPVQLGECVGVACLPEADEDAAAGTRCTITGWGRMNESFSGADILQEAVIEIVDHDVCMEKWAGGSPSVTESNICIGAADEKMSTACHGDSGGPLVCETASGWKVFGVTSFGDSIDGVCSVQNKPAAYTSVHHYYDWIQGVLQGIFPTPQPTPAPTPPQPTPAPPPGTWVLTGSGCEIAGECIQSNNYPSPYGSDEQCEVELYGDIPLRVQGEFATESGFDKLTVGGVVYAGEPPPNLSDLDGIHTGTISWSTDGSVERTGWRLCRFEPPPPTPAPPPGSWVIRGDGCKMDGGCIQSNNHPSNYGNNEQCEVELYGDIPLQVNGTFATESGYDKLIVNGVVFEGRPPLNVGDLDGIHTGIISWSSDSSVTNSGWKLCRTD